MGGIWSTVSGGADWLAGSTDEAVGEATQDATQGDLAGVGDALAGSTDEATAEFTGAVTSGDVLGAGDAVLGGVDEATAGFADWSSGSVDESIGRQFDSQEGGGIADQAGQTVENVASDTLGHAMGVLTSNPAFLVLALVAGYVVLNSDVAQEAV